MSIVLPDKEIDNALKTLVHSIPYVCMYSHNLIMQEQTIIEVELIALHPYLAPIKIRHLLLMTLS